MGLTARSSGRTQTLPRKHGQKSGKGTKTVYDIGHFTSVASQVRPLPIRPPPARPRNAPRVTAAAVRVPAQARRVIRGKRQRRQDRMRLGITDQPERVPPLRPDTSFSPSEQLKVVKAVSLLGLNAPSNIWEQTARYVGKGRTPDECRECW